MQFTGFNDWVEIFRGGKQTDSAGKQHDGDALIEKAVAGFNPKRHEPPVVLGHPADNAPAYGWVESLKADARDGVKTLYAKFRGVVPEFENMVKMERYKKRSASFYPDGSLRHVGWLGAMPPAVKGLADVAFSEADQASNFDFEEQPQTQTKENGDMSTIEELTRQLADEKAAREKADAAAAKFKDAAEKAQADFAEASRKAGRKAVADFIEKAAGAGNPLVIACKDKGLGLFMEHLEGVAENQAGEFEFSEGKGKQTPGAWFREFVTSFNDNPLLKDMARPKGDKKEGDDQGGSMFSEELKDRV